MIQISKKRFCILFPRVTFLFAIREKVFFSTSRGMAENQTWHARKTTFPQNKKHQSENRPIAIIREQLGLSHVCISCEMATWINKTKQERSRRARSRGDYGASFFLFPKTGAYIYSCTLHTEPKSDVTFDPQNLADSSAAAASHWLRFWAAVCVQNLYSHSLACCVYIKCTQHTRRERRQKISWIKPIMSRGAEKLVFPLQRRTGVH